MTDVDANKFAQRHQCIGELDFLITTDLVATDPVTLDFPLVDESYVFGDDVGGDCSSDKEIDIYEDPQVMACCGGYTGNELEDAYAYNCMIDLVQQTCRSLVHRYKQKIEDTVWPNQDWVDAAEALNEHLALNTTLDDCISSFIANDSDLDPDEMVSFWDVPNDGAWDSYFANTRAEILGSSITGIFIPEDEGDWIECHSLNDNNGQYLRLGRPNRVQACATCGVRAQHADLWLRRSVES